MHSQDKDVRKGKRTHANPMLTRKKTSKETRKVYEHVHHCSLHQTLGCRETDKPLGIQSLGWNIALRKEERAVLEWQLYILYTYIRDKTQYKIKPFRKIKSHTHTSFGLKALDIYPPIGEEESVKKFKKMRATTQTARMRPR